MRVFCSICKDIFLPYSEVQVTNCGHLYHTSCISTWIKQHRTCPQCRAKLAQPIKVYFDVEKDSEVDLSVLEHQVETLSDKLRESERSIKSLEQENSNYVKIIQGLEEDYGKLKNKSKILKGSVKALKGQVTSLTKENETLASLKREVTEWKNKVATLEKIETIINGSADEVNKMLENTPVTELAVKHLCTYVYILKVQLQKSEGKYMKLDKVLKDFSKNMAEEKKKYSSDSDLIKTLKLNISKLELQLSHTKALFRDYRKKHPEKTDVNLLQNITNQALKKVKKLGFWFPPYIFYPLDPKKSEVSKNAFDSDVGLDENQSVQLGRCDKSSRDVLQDLHVTQDFVKKLDLIMEIDENQTTKPTDCNKTINQWEEFVSAGPSTSLASNKSTSLIRSSFTTKTERYIARSCVYAFDGLGGRKKLRLGGPTPQEEFEKIKKKKTHKVVSSCQHKNLLDFC